MSNVVVVSGDFSSGTTLLFTLFRNTSQYCCLYEPLHELLPEYLVWPLRAYEGHHFVGEYFAELKRFRHIPRLFRPEWGTHELFLGPEAEATELYRYLSYLIGSAFAVSDKVLIKENRITFRLGWLRSRFPNVRIVHVWRNREEQWRSIVRRVQEYVGREDVGQESPEFRGFNLATWCDDLAPVFPELASHQSDTGYQRFCRLWELSMAEHWRHADASVELAELKCDFEGAWARVATAVGCDVPAAALRSYVMTTERDRGAVGAEGLRARSAQLIDRVGREYARRRVARRLHRP